MKFDQLKVILRTIASYFLLFTFGSILALPALILIAILPDHARRTSKVLFWLLDKLYKTVFWFSFMPKEIIGKENISPEPAIIAPNHQSSMDIPVVGALMNGAPHIWFALEYYAKKPLLGFFIRRIGVAVDRDNPTKAARSLINLLKIAETTQSHVIIFPEGTRNIDGHVHTFSQGVSLIAKKTGRPVIPIYMPNNGAIYPPGSFLIHWNKIRVIIGTPLYMEADETEDQFTQKIYTWFSQQQ